MNRIFHSPAHEPACGRVVLLHRPNIRAELQLNPNGFIGSLLSLFRTHWDHEPGRIGRSRDSVLDCGSLLPLSMSAEMYQSARGLAQSKTWRILGRFIERRPAHGAA
jgi:hypothetical protein